MKRFVESMMVEYSMLYGGTVTAKVSKITDTEVTLTESWIAEDTGETVTEDTTYKKCVDGSGNEYLVIWEYKGYEGKVYAE